ncbi:MAG: hypothetical protein JRI63_12730 [Deltaproteobacteria bacterium]|nr:hypothetical protein [Deltaproteobacteria bacterium]
MKTMTHSIFFEMAYPITDIFPLLSPEREKMASVFNASAIHAKKKQSACQWGTRIKAREKMDERRKK